jgi:transposase
MDTSTVVAAVDSMGRRIARRQHRTVEEKIRIVAESRIPGSSVAEVARRYSMNANQLFAWRRMHDQGLLRQHTRRVTGAVKLLPVKVSEEPVVPSAAAACAAAPVSEDGRIEIALADDLRVVIYGSVPAERIAQVVAVLRR